MRINRYFTAGLLISALIPIIAVHGEDRFELGRRAAHSGDFSTASRYWQELAEEGDARAMTALGKMYLFGDGVIANEARAKEWFRKAEAAGSTEARQQLAKLEEPAAAGAVQVSLTSGDQPSASETAPSNETAQSSDTPQASQPEPDPVPNTAELAARLRLLYAQTENQPAESPAAPLPEWQISRKVDPMSDEETIEALGNVVIPEKNITGQLKMSCGSDFGNGATISLVVDGDTFRMEPAPSGIPFLFYNTRFGKNPSVKNRISSRTMKFHNEAIMDFPLKDSIPMMMKQLAKASVEVEFLMKVGQFKASDAWTGTFEDLIGNRTVRLQFPFKQHEPQIFEIDTRDLKAQEFFNGCIKIAEKMQVMEKLKEQSRS